jgi:hypothetical protein
MSQHGLEVHANRKNDFLTAMKTMVKENFGENSILVHSLATTFYGFLMTAISWGTQRSAIILCT